MAQNADFRLVYLNANKFIICHKGYYSQYIDLLGELKGNNAQAFESQFIFFPKNKVVVLYRMVVCNKLCRLFALGHDQNLCISFNTT